MVATRGGGRDRDMQVPELAPHPRALMRRRWALEHGLLAKAGEPLPPGEHNLLAIRLDFGEEEGMPTTSPPWRAVAQKLSVDAKASTPQSATA